MTPIALLLGIGLLLAGSLPAAWAAPVPQLQGRVNDYARMLGDPAKRHLETILADLERTDGTQIAVLTVPSLEGQPIEEFSIQVAEQWGIGQKQNDNGALLVIAKNDRKLRIEAGFGLEGRLTDLAAGRIIRNVIGPRFKAGHFDEGIIDGVTAMIGTVKGEYTAPETGPRGGHGKRNGSPGPVGLIVLFFLLNVVGRVNRLLGGVVGAVLAPIAGLLFFNLGAPLLLALIPVGFAAGFLISLLGPGLSFGHPTHRSRNTTSWGGGGGGFSSGGGFGGFSGGGGGFGGGGASGSW
ncbi:MAG: TPM domain-containing protein [Desulfatitalea sp.]|nr:TPM domain-containing protein [Desulfatitalea sp.]